MVDVDGRHVIDLVNMWTPSSASGAVDLEANKEYEVSAKGGPGGLQLSVRPPQDTTTFRSEVGQAIDYYFFYGPELNQVIADYRQLTGEAPMFPKWVYGLLAVPGDGITARRKSSTLGSSSANATFRLTPWCRTGSTGASMAGTP